MDVLRALADEIRKMFAADLWLTATTLAVVAAVALALRAGLVEAKAAPALLAAGVLLALIVGVAHGARRS